MRLFELFESAYSNWTFPSQQTIAADFSEYKKKEDSKWHSRADAIGARFPIFKDIKDFEQSLRNAKVVNVTSSLDNRVMNRSHTTSLDDLRDLVSGYVRPRDVDRIVKGFKNNDAIPYPIILKGSKGMWIMAGNTRLDTAGIIGVPKKALMVDVSEILDEADSYAPKPVEQRTAERVAAFIKKNCKPWLSQTDNGKFVVYRGFSGGYTRYTKNASVFTKKVRINRRPLGSPPELHRLFNTVIALAGKTANRSNSVAVIGDESKAWEYGDQFVTIPIGNFNYTWHTELGPDWTSEFSWFIEIAGDHVDLDDFDTYPGRKLPKKITKQYLDKVYGARLVGGVRGDDKSLAEAIRLKYEIMIKADEIIAIDPRFYNREILPLLQSPSKLKEGHKHKWSYIGGAAVCKCGKQISPDGEISDATAGMMKARKKMFEDRQKGTSLSSELADKYVVIYRAQPSTASTIDPMSYVTRSIKFARDHAVHMANTEEIPYHVVRALVATKDVYNAYNPGEYFYDGKAVNGKTVFIAKPGDDFQ